MLFGSMGVWSEDRKGMRQWCGICVFGRETGLDEELVSGVNVEWRTYGTIACDTVPTYFLLMYTVVQYTSCNRPHGIRIRNDV